MIEWTLFDGGTQIAQYYGDTFTFDFPPNNSTEEKDYSLECRGENDCYDDMHFYVEANQEDTDGTYSRNVYDYEIVCEYGNISVYLNNTVEVPFSLDNIISPIYYSRKYDFNYHYDVSIELKRVSYRRKDNMNIIDISNQITNNGINTYIDDYNHTFHFLTYGINQIYFDLSNFEGYDEIEEILFYCYVKILEKGALNTSNPLAEGQCSFVFKHQSLL